MRPWVRPDHVAIKSWSASRVLCGRAFQVFVPSQSDGLRGTPKFMATSLQMGLPIRGLIQLVRINIGRVNSKLRIGASKHFSSILILLPHRRTAGPPWLRMRDAGLRVSSDILTSELAFACCTASSHNAPESRASAFCTATALWTVVARCIMLPKQELLHSAL